MEFPQFKSRNAFLMVYQFIHGHDILFSYIHFSLKAQYFDIALNQILWKVQLLGYYNCIECILINKLFFSGNWFESQATKMRTI